MMRRDSSEILEICLQRLSQDEPIEQILASYADQAATLRPILETAQWASASKTQKTIPSDAQTRSRAKMLSAAVTLRKPQPAPRFLPHTQLRFATLFTVLIIVMVGLALGAGLVSVSAAALPGESLYPVKLAMEQARLRLSTKSSSRLALEENFDQQRVQEVSQLLQKNRAQSVEFAGFLQNTAAGWQISGIPVHLDPKITEPVQTLVGTYVEVKGDTGGGQVQVLTLRLRLFHLAGTIEDVQKDLWMVSGVRVTIDPNTQIIGAAVPGDSVELTTIRVENDRLLALAARIGDSRLLQWMTPTPKP